MQPSQQDWCFYLSPGAAWQAMLADCEAATQLIEMEQYIFHNDETGQHFIRLFIDKARQGVKVRLLCDEHGSGSFYHSPLIDELRAAGGIFEFYNAVTLIDILKPKRFFPRTHLKALVIDGAIAYIGGICIAKRMEGWRDTDIRVTGPVALQVQKALMQNSREADDKIKMHHARRHENIDAQADFYYVQNEPGFLRHPIYHALLEHIASARDHIYISMAFFIPTRRLRRFLKKAAARGVKVTILIPQKSDAEVADWVALSYAARLLRGGVKIFLYLPTVLHTKTVVIDGKWGTIGSCNLDPLSLFHNREANLIVNNPEILAQMQKDFFKDLEQSRELTLDLLKQTPLWKRALAHIARLFRPFL